MATPSPARIRIPESAFEELDAVEQWNWSEGVSLEELIDWLNQVTHRFQPEEIGESSRASQEFTPRTFRHYQTLGCIDAPLRTGRKAAYFFRHYLQGLLLRKLIWERVPSSQIALLMHGRTLAEYKTLLREGIEIVPSRPGNPGGESSASGSSSEGRPWLRYQLANGIELQIRSDLLPMDSETAAEAFDAARLILANALRQPQAIYSDE